MQNLVKCPKCLVWLIGEQVADHECWSPRYFYGPEIGNEGQIYGWESEDGKTWRKKLMLNPTGVNRKDDPTTSYQNLARLSSVMFYILNLTNPP